MRLVQRGRTSASPAQVWEVLGTPARWPEFEPALRRVRGTSRTAAPGQALVGVSRVALVGLPIDVLEVVPASRLVLRVHVAPGVQQTMSFEVVPAVGGGSHVRLGFVVDGMLARLAVAPLWLSGGLTLRLLLARTERIARAARRAA